MEILKTRVFTRRNVIITLFVIFLFLRLFGGVPYALSSDSVKYLALSKNFPYHTLSNNQLDINHPPLHPYAIYFATLIFQDDYIAAVFISLLSAAITFFVLYKLFMLLSRNFMLHLPH